MLSRNLASPVAVTLVIMSIAATQPASAGNESRSHAFAMANGLVEVVADFSENSIYWCGAGTFARSDPSIPGTAKIYVWEGPSPSVAKPGEQSVKFGFRPPPGVTSAVGLTTDVTIVGVSLSVVDARQTCNERTTSG